MRRWLIAAVTVFIAQWSVSASAATETAPGPQHVAAYDASGMIGVPLLTLGVMQLGHLLDIHRVPKDAEPGSGFTRLGFLVGVGLDLPALWGLAKLTNVPVTWGSAAAGVGLGLASGIVLLGVDTGVMALFHLRGRGVAAGILSLATVVAWSVATVLFVKADPFHLTRGTTPTMAQMSAPLLSVAF